MSKGKKVMLNFGRSRQAVFVLSIVVSANCVWLETARAASVRFLNETSQSFELHVRNGPIGTNPDGRGHQNTTMKSGDTWDDNVGDGDTWYAYGNKQINNQDNPALCNAAGGATVKLDKSQQCYVDN